MRDRKVGVWALMHYQIPSDETLRGQEMYADQAMQQRPRRERNSCARARAHEKTKVVARKGRRIGPFSPVARKVRYFLAVSQTSASASPENNRQPEQDDCDRHKRRAGDVSDQDEDDRDDGEDCCDVVVHSFSIVGLLTLRCEPTPCRLCGGAQVA